MDLPLDAMHDSDDEALLELYACGDAAAARALTARLGPRVLSHAHRLLADRAEAEDVTQEALLRLWRIAPDWRRGEAKVTTWLYRVTANLCTDRLRRRRGTDLDSVPEIADDQPPVEVALQRQAREQALQAALMRLPERQRQAVVLRHIEGLANPEIGQIMDLTTRAVESLTARGKRSLEVMLLGQREELGLYDDT
ncbi:RNA polymerase sigma factor [Puniceibacterium confluentis]|uniref:RNA polymerase sigma factor n=1 Tax=Puniceibacterium confluentis TaxID=1958944 RepID=UPI0011B53716|nr:RNA polymerase sigma factor [Puniceibacterium confluentis]